MPNSPLLLNNLCFGAHFLHESRLITDVFIQPRSQGLSFNRPLRRARRDPGLVWSRATLTIENIREESSVIRQFVALSFVALWALLTAISGWNFESSYPGVYLKVRQVCLETIYRSRDVVARRTHWIYGKSVIFQQWNRAAQFLISFRSDSY